MSGVIIHNKKFENGKQVDTFKVTAPLPFEGGVATFGEAEVGLTYETLKYAYFNNSKGWFIQNIRSECQFHDKSSMYDRYNEWCIEHHLMPIKKPDFIAKVSYLFGKMAGATISAADLEKVKEIWSQS